MVADQNELSVGRLDQVGNLSELVPEIPGDQGTSDKTHVRPETRIMEADRGLDPSRSDDRNRARMVEATPKGRSARGTDDVRLDRAQSLRFGARHPFARRRSDRRGA